MPSRRYRSRKSLGTRLNKIRYSVSKSENTSIPSVVGNNAVTTFSFGKNAVATDYMTSGSVDSTTYSLSAYLPSGEGNQRVPAPLNDVTYWTQVVEGRVELHQSGIHGDGELEDIQNVSAGLEGLIFDPTNGDARIYLTGRLDVPKSRKVYGTWNSIGNVPIKLIYWEQTPQYFIESAYRSDGVTHLDLSDIAHSLAVGDLVTVTKTTDDFDGLYRVVEVKADYVSAVMYEQRYTLTVDDSAYDVDTTTATFTLNGENPTTTVIKPNDLVVLSSVAGYESLAGPHRILTVDDTTTPNTIVFTFSGIYTADVNDFYNTVSATIYTGVPLDTVNQQNFNPLGTISEDVYHYIELENTSIWGADGYTFPITSAVVANDVATVTTSFAHYASVGDTITVGGLDESTNQFATTTVVDVFDVLDAPIIAVDQANKTISYYQASTPTDIPPPGYVAVNFGPSTATVKAFATTTNANTPQQYAVYAEVAQGSNAASLTEAKVFEVVGEPPFILTDYNFTAINLNVIVLGGDPPLGYVTLSTPLPSDVKKFILRLDDPDFSFLNGSHLVQKIEGNNVFFNDPSTSTYSGAATGVLTAQIPTKNYEMSPNGLVFYRENGTVDTRLGSVGLDELSLANASIDVAGVANFTDVYTGALYSTEPSFFEANTTFNAEVKIYSTLTNTTNNLYGTADLARYHDLANATTNSPHTATSNVLSYTGDILNRFARGLIYSVNFGPMTTNTTFEFTRDRSPIAAGSFTLDADRNYLFTISFGTIRLDSAANVGSRIEFIAGSNTATANLNLDTTDANNAVHVKQSVTFDASQSGTVHPMVFDYTSTSTALTNGMTNYLVQSGVEIFWQVRYVYASTPRTDSTFRVSDTEMQGKYGLSIYDMGPATAGQIGSLNTANVVTRYANTGTFAGGGGGSNTTTVTANAVATSLDSAYYDNGGIGDAGTSDPYANEDSIYQGNPGTSSGTKKSHVTFPSVQTVVGATAYAYANFTVTKIEVYLKNRHSYLSGGLSAKIGFTTDTTVGATLATADNGYTPISSSFTKGQGKYVTLSTAMRTQIASAGTSAWGILLGLIDDNPDTYDGTLSNYGYFDGDNQSDPPKVRVTYTYTV